MKRGRVREKKREESDTMCVDCNTLLKEDVSRHCKSWLFCLCLFVFKTFSKCVEKGKKKGWGWIEREREKDEDE